MRLLDRLFFEHPASVDETYWQHFANATSFALAMIGGGLCCLVHALVPGVFPARGGDTICALYERMIVKRRMRFAPHTLVATPRPPTAG